MAVTLAKIAELAELSPSSVSLVLNGGQTHRVSPETRERIERIASELGYRPNRHAQGLARGKTRVVTLLINQFTNPFYGRYVSELERQFAAEGYQVAPAETEWENERERGLMSRYRQGTCDLVMSLAHYYTGQDQEFKGLPAVVRHDDWDGQALRSPISCVVVDQRPALKALVDHFAGSGRRTLGLMLHENNQPYADRPNRSAYAHSLRTTVSRSPMVSGERYQAIAHERDPLQTWHDAAYEMLRREPQIDAMLVHTFEFVTPVIEAARRLGRRVGHDLALATFDDPPAAAWLDGGVTVIREPVEQIAKALAQRALAILHGRRRLPNVRIAGELVVRRSSQPDA